MFEAAPLSSSRPPRCQEGHDVTVLYLLKNKAEVDATSSGGKTALHASIEGGMRTWSLGGRCASRCFYIVYNIKYAMLHVKYVRFTIMLFICIFA